jgi:hypothetical protein
MHSSDYEQDGDWRGAARVLLAVAAAYAFTVEVFLHRRMGAAAAGMQAVLALVIIPAHVAMFPEHDPRPLLCLLPAYLGACFCSRTGVLLRERRGDYEHSRYTGWPWLMNFGWARRIGEKGVKTVVEPLLVAGLGGLTLEFNQPLGSYWLVAALCLLMKAGVDNRSLAERSSYMRDLAIEHRYFS